MIKKQNHLKKSGYSLTEVVVASSILLMTVAVGLSGYIFSLKNTYQADVQSELDADVQLAIEMLKKDIRLSSMSLVQYYPATPPYTAISFPIAYDTDGDGMLQRENKYIIWNETVIYHVKTGTPNELIRTSFSPRDNSLDSAARFDQLEYVVKNGGHQDATSKVIFQNLLSWELNPRNGQYNGYDSIHTFDKNVFLGYAFLDNGDHEITFETVEAGQGGGYKIGIDQLMASPAATPREGETLTTKDESGASTQVLLDRQAKGNYQLQFPATEVGDSFTAVVHNDKWTETNFENPASVKDVEIEFNEETTPKDIVVRLSGMNSVWDVENQTASSTYSSPGVALKGTAIRLLQKGDSIANGGFIQSGNPRSRLVFRASTAQALRIGNVYFGASADDESINMGYASTPVQLNLIDSYGNASSALTIPAGHSVTSSWADIAISSTNNYLVSYTVADNPLQDSPAIWVDQNVPTNSAYATARIAFITGGASYSAATLAAEPDNWDTLSDTSGLSIQPSLFGIGLESIQTCYAPTGTFTSRIVDTTLDAPVYEQLSWTQDLPYGTALYFKVRTGNKSDLSDADSWDVITPSTLISAGYKRYVQFQAILTSDADMLKTPELKDTTIDWDGESRLVSIGGSFSKGPDHGVFEVSVDGEKLTSALIVDLEIYKDIRTMNNTIRRISSSQKVELSPRNTGF